MKASPPKQLTEDIIGAAVEVHRVLGPGLLESAYEECLCHELSALKIPFERQVILPLKCNGRPVGQGYRLGLLVADAVVVEVKAVEALLPDLVGGLRRIANDYRDP